jgi:hypothetical protein
MQIKHYNTTIKWGFSVIRQFSASKISIDNLNLGFFNPHIGKQPYVSRNFNNKQQLNNNNNNQNNNNILYVF